MKLSIGIVGLPNVGKSTLFNALLKKQVANVANYPFCTIEPNVGIVEVPDDRLPILAKIVNTTKIVPAVIEFYDIAGLVKGAAKGEGLGNKFLSHIREVAAIVHVVRLFEDENIVHVSREIDPVSDIQTIDAELILADLETLNKQSEPRLDATKEDRARYALVQRIKPDLDKGVPVRSINLTDEEKVLLAPLNLLTAKPVLYLFNVSEQQLGKQDEVKKKIDEITEKVKSTNPDSQKSALFLSAQLESEMVVFEEKEQQDLLKQYGLDQTGLNRLIKKAYETLGLISFLTAGEIEAKAWTIKKGTLAPQAASVIHTDFEKHFIRADIASFSDFVAQNGWTKARENGKVQTVGRDYEMKDGDVVEFKIGV